MSKKALEAEVLPDDYNQYDLSFNMVVIGDTGVGKSCLTSMAAKGVFYDSYSAGIEFLIFNVRIDGKIIKLQIWDTLGQEKYRTLISSYYRNASIAMMVYAINSKKSFNHIETWLKEVKLQSNPDIKIFLIGNKADLKEDRQVSSEEANQFKDEMGIHFFTEVSAKNGLNAQEVFIEAAKLLYSEHLKYRKKVKEDAQRDDIPVPIKINNKNKKKRNLHGGDKPVPFIIAKNKGDIKQGFNDKLYKNFPTLTKWMNI